jgi:hypothetical protein
MNLRTILGTLFVAGITASASLTVSAAEADEDPTAAGLFTKMQAKVAGAKTVSVTIDASIKDLMSLNAKVKTTSGNKANVVMESKKQGGDNTHRVHIISDGTNQKTSSPMQTEDKLSPVDPHLGDNLIATLTHTGVLAMYLPVTSQRGTSAKLTDRIKAAGFTLGDKKTIGKKTVRAVHYNLISDEPQFSSVVTVWIDLKTHLPQSRTVIFKGFQAEETYMNWKLDTKIGKAEFSIEEKN